MLFSFCNYSGIYAKFSNPFLCLFQALCLLETKEYLSSLTKFRVILILDPINSMEKSDQTPNYYEKFCVIFSETVPKYLRRYFIERWNAKFPEQLWKSGSESSGNDLVNAIPENKKQKQLKKFNKYKGKLHCGNEEEWDTDILIDIMLDFGLDICDNSVKGDIVKLRKASSQLASCEASKPPLPDQSEKMIADITGAAKKLFQKDAEDEISKIWHSEIKPLIADEQCMQPSKEIECSIEPEEVVESGTEHTSGKLLFQYNIFFFLTETVFL